MIMILYEVISIKRFVLLLGSLLVLVGCTETAIIVPFEDYEERPLKESEVAANDEEDFLDQPHREIHVFNKTDQSALAVLQGVCWNESGDDDCDVKPTNPQDDVIDNHYRLVVEKGEQIVIDIPSQNPEELSIVPKRVELIQFNYHDEEGTIIASGPGYRQYVFNAPEEERTYFYLYHVIWNETETKRAYYGFSLHVRE